MWDWTELTFMATRQDTSAGPGASPEDKAAVFEAARQGRIIGAGSQLRAIEKDGCLTESGARKLLLDVFLPIDPKKGWPMYKPGFPLNNPTPQFVNQDAAAAINAALSRGPHTKINRTFEDGPDHLHLEVISARST